MEQVLTLVCKLQPTDEQAQHMDETLTRFADACTYIHTTLPANIRNKDRMQAMIYYDVRSRFQLSANLAIQAIRRVAMNRKAAHETGNMVETFAPTSIQYDARIFSFRERDWTVSLTLLHGRERLALSLGHYQRGKLKGHQPKAAQLCKHRDGTYAVHIQRHTNHVISKALVVEATERRAMIVLEDLTGIRARTNTQPRSKTERRRGNSWAFDQLRQFVAYKAVLACIFHFLVPPAYTSHMCHACLHIGQRHHKHFACTNPACGWSGDADWNAAQNIALLGLSLSKPRGPWLSCELQGSQKPQALEAWVA